MIMYLFLLVFGKKTDWVYDLMNWVMGRLKVAQNKNKNTFCYMFIITIKILIGFMIWFYVLVYG